MKIGPKYKICRRLGETVFDKCETPKYQMSRARKGSIKNAKRRMSRRPRTGYGQQLAEKQKVRFSYYVSERQLSNYAATARKKYKQNPAGALYTALESRLDNVVYRAGIAPTRAFARQMVSHGHISVNGRKCTIPSRLLYQGDEAAPREGSRSKEIFKEREGRRNDRVVPEWLSYNPKTQTAKVVAAPQLEESGVTLDFNTVIEFYSRV